MVAVTQLPRPEHRRPVLSPSAPVPGRVAGRQTTATFRRRRAVAALVVASTLAALVLAVSALAGSSLSGPPTAADQRGASGPVHVVRPGDTFWAIARAWHPNEDPRPLVARLVAAHGSPVLVVGERIRLPIGE